MVEEARLLPMKEKLLAARAKRVRPGLDDKVLADWNGLMIAALARAGALLDEPEWVALARTAFDAVVRLMVKDGRLGHSYREGRLVLPGLASDLAAMARAGIAVHEATGEDAPLAHATDFLEQLERDYLDPQSGAYFLTASDAQSLVVRPFSSLDEALPNYNSVAADALVRLAAISGRDDLRERADRVIGALSGAAAQNPLAHPSLLNALDTRLRLAEIVAVGPSREAFATAALHLPFLSRVVARAAEVSALPQGSVARARAESAPAEGAAFVCVAERCSLPVTDPEALAATVRNFAG